MFCFSETKQESLRPIGHLPLIVARSLAVSVSLYRQVILARRRRYNVSSSNAVRSRHVLCHLAPSSEYIVLLLCPHLRIFSCPRVCVFVRHVYLRLFVSRGVLYTGEITSTWQRDMASSDNVTNEKAIDFEDGDYDPDIEVRLYAEIYYSNETYLPDYGSSIPNDKATLNVARNAATTVSSNESLVSNDSVADGRPAPANTDDRSATNEFAEDSAPGDDIDDRQNSDVGPSHYPKTDRVSSEVSESTRDREAIVQPPVGVRSAGRRQRQLARKGLWLTPENTERGGSTIGRANATPVHEETPTPVHEATPTPDGRTDDPTDVGIRSAGRRQRQLAQKGLWLTPENTERDGSTIGRANVTAVHEATPTPVHEATPTPDGRTDDPTDVGIRSAGRRQRQLAQKGLWLTPENTERDGSTIGRADVTPIHEETPTPDGRADDPTDVDGLSTNQENASTRSDGRKRKQKNRRGNVSEQACSKVTLSRHDAADDTGETVETDKYEVVSKKKKMRKKKRNSVPLVIGSDSDDSIVEVPVPPKPPPLIIQLPDSEDECDPSVDDGSKKTNESTVEKNNRSVSCGDLPTDSLTPDAPSISPVSETSPSPTHETSHEATHPVRGDADVSVEPAPPDGDTLILNCTEIQRVASSLDEIRQMRGTGPPTIVHTDDSMTECEATNLVNIAAGQTNATRNRDLCSIDLSNKTIDITAGQEAETRDQKICSVDLSNERVIIELWNQTRNKNSASAGIPTENPCTSGAGSTVDRTVANKEKTSTVSTINKEKSSSVSTINKEKTSSVPTINKEKTSSMSTINKEKTSSASTETSSVSTINKEKTPSASTVNKEKTSSASTVNKGKTSSVSAVNKGKTSSVSAANKGKTSSGSTINKEVARARKRPKKAESRPFTDFDVPAIPPKRSKRLRDKAMSDYFFKPMSNELQAFYNNPWGGENLNLYDIQSRMPENPKCWGILDADLQGPTTKRRRTCPRCNSDSHIGSRCPEKAKTISCYMCGAKGHIESRCPHRMCLTCGRKYATYRPTCDYCCKLNCNICNGSGHSNANCPDLWRRYHNTTTETIPVVPGDPSNIMKAPEFLWCCNCGRRGHDVTTCQQLRWSQHFPTPMSVSSYTEGPFYEPSNREQMPYASSNRDQMQYESSNREQMQYESSNRDQMQYESSNDAQMQYESSNDAQMQYESSIRDQMQHESSNRDRMQYESSNRDRMQYESSNRDQMQYESSNRDQMQYESSNRDQTQYESSNRERMQYESSNGEPMQYKLSSGEQMQYALLSENWIHDVPHEQRIAYPNPNADPIYVPQHEERIQDTTSKDIEVLEVYDGPDASIAEPASSVASSNVIFQSRDTVLPEASFLRSASRRLDKVKNIHLDGLLNGRLKPTFLLDWNKSFEFSLRITREHNNIARMTIEADFVTLLEGLEKVMMQWLMRPDDEKPNLEYDIFPYDDTNEMIATAKQKILLLSSVLEPTILWNKIVACEESIKHIRAKRSQCINQKKAQKRYEKNENGIINNTMKRRSQLVTSLYGRRWVSGGGPVVRSFKSIAHKLMATQKVSITNYMEMIYLNNELFTFHTSEALSKALDKAILESQRSKSKAAPRAKKPSVVTSGGKAPESITSSVAKKPAIDASGGKLPESSTKLMANVDVCEKEKPTVHLPNQPMINNNSLSAYCSPLTQHCEQQVTVVKDTDLQIPKIFGTTDAGKNTSSNANDETGIISHTVRNPLFRPSSVKRVDSQNAVHTQSSFQRKIIQPGGKKKVNDPKGLLRLLTKGNRKRYKMLAKQAIKVANLTNKPRLQKMAKALKLKLGNGSVTTDDVDTLRAAAQPEPSQRITQIEPSQRSRESLKVKDNAYQKFLKRL